MSNWYEFQQYLRAEYTLDRDDEDEMALTLVYNVEGKTRKQRVFLRRYVAINREMVEIRSAFGELSDYDPQHLLEESLGLPIGGVAIHGGILVIVQKEPLQSHTSETLAELMSQIGFLADCLESAGGGDRY